MMHPTDHMSTENKNEMKVNKKTGTQQQINEKTSNHAIAQSLQPTPQTQTCLLLSADAFLLEHTRFMTT